MEGLNFPKILQINIALIPLHFLPHSQLIDIEYLFFLSQIERLRILHIATFCPISQLNMRIRLLIHFEIIEVIFRCFHLPPRTATPRIHAVENYVFDFVPRYGYCVVVSVADEGYGGGQVITGLIFLEGLGTHEAFGVEAFFVAGFVR